jgi:glycosyltransferase involved in cell wall biosynthesis
LRVQFDDQIFRLQQRGGISRYFIELFNAFASDESLGIKAIIPRFTTSDQLLESGWGYRLPAYLDRQRLRVLGNRLSSGIRSAQLVHRTYYQASYLSPDTAETKTVITIHDMIPELFPEYFPNGNPHFDKQRFVQHADLILCVSENTKRDLVKVYGAPSAPVVVTSLGVSDTFSSGARQEPLLQEPYVLFVGNRDGYKDFTVLARAFAETPLPGDFRLIAIGGGTWTESEVALLEALEIAHRVVRMDLDDGSLARVYAHAVCFVFPARYEGFGLPTLEAMASGCPTILANAPVHAEVGGDAAVYFAAGDHQDLARALHEVTDDLQLRERSRTGGRERAARFPWRETARLTAAAYKTLDANLT